MTHPLTFTMFVKIPSRAWWRNALLLALLPCVLPCLFTFVAKAAENHHWPQFRGPAGDGHATASNLPTTWSETENVRWKTPIPGLGWCSPVIWDSQIWLTTANEDGKQMFVLCLDRESGKVLHHVKLFDVESPREIHILNSYASPSPVIEEGRVYVHFGSYGTACLDTTTARVIWQRRDLPCDHHRGPGSSPILHDDKLIIHYDGFDVQYVVALDKTTGKTIWQSNRDVDFGTTDGDVMKAYCTPLVIQVNGAEQLISPCSKAALAYDPQTGKELWRVRYESFSATVRPLFGHGMVYINSGFGRADLLAVRPDGSGDVTESHVVWKSSENIGSKPSHLLIDDLIFLVHDNGVASCLDALTGKKVWTTRLGGNFSASPIYADGKIFFLSEEGVTTVVEPSRTYTELASNRLADGFMASPAALGEALYLRTTTHLYRIEKPAAAAQ